MTTPELDSLRRDMRKLRADILGFVAVILLAVALFHIGSAVLAEKQRQNDAVYCASVWLKHHTDYKGTYDKLCNRGRPR